MPRALYIITIILLLYKWLADIFPYKRPVHLHTKWKSLFSSCAQAKEDISDVQHHLADTYQSHQQLKEKSNLFLNDMAELYEFVHRWKEAPAEYLDPIKAKLGDAFDRQGITEWVPEAGVPAPEGCEKYPAQADTSFPVGSVVEVLSPGLRITQSDGDDEVIKRPLVTVVTERDA